MWTKPTYEKIRLGFEVTMYRKTVWSMYGGIPLFSVFCLILIVCDTAIHVMIQMYFEGHPAFKDWQTSKSLLLYIVLYSNTLPPFLYISVTLLTPTRQGNEMRKRDIAMATAQSVGTIVLAFAIPAVIVLANNGF